MHLTPLHSKAIVLIHFTIITLHFTSPNFKSLHYFISLQLTSLYFTSPYFLSLQFNLISFNLVYFHLLNFRFASNHCIKLNFLTTPTSPSFALIVLTPLITAPDNHLGPIIFPFCFVSWRICLFTSSYSSYRYIYVYIHAFAFKPGF